MTYYKYVERDATSQVNWADVSKKFSDEIARIGGERDKKRAEIDKATDELVTKINEAPLGQHKNANLFTSQLVDQATEDTLRMNRLLKSGDIKPSEYMNYIENQKSSVTGIYDMVKGYQDVYTDKMTRLQNGDSLSMEADGMAVVEGFGNFANITPVMDMYGNVTMYNNSTGDTMSAAQMNAITKQYFNAYDLDGDLTAKAGQLGEYTKSIMEDGVKTREDVTASPAYQKVKNDLIDATLEGNLAVSTVLDRKLPGYSTSYSAKTAGANDILMIDDPRQPGSGAQIPLVEVVEQVAAMGPEQRREIFPEGADVDGLIKIAKDQREAARNWAKKDLTSRFNMIETPQAEFAPTPPTRLSAGERKGLADAETGVQMLQRMWGARNEDDVQTAIGFFEGLNPGMKLRVAERNGVRSLLVTPEGGETSVFEIGDDYESFVGRVSTILTDATYFDEAKRKNPLDRDRYPQAGTATGEIERIRVLDPEKIREETVDMFGEGETVGNILNPDRLESIPVGLTGRGAAYGINRKESDAKANLHASEIRRVLEQLGVSENIQVSMRTTDDTGSDFPSIVVTSPGSEREFSMQEGLYEGMGDYIIQLISDVSVESQPETPQSTGVNYAEK